MAATYLTAILIHYTTVTETSRNTSDPDPPKLVVLSVPVTSRQQTVPSSALTGSGVQCSGVVVWCRGYEVQ